VRGVLGPKLFHVVRCAGCQKSYNGKTGGSLTWTIAIYQVVAIGIIAAFSYLLLFAL
jgi:hypothetical protein